MNYDEFTKEQLIDHITRLNAYIELIEEGKISVEEIQKLKQKLNKINELNVEILRINIIKEMINKRR